MSRSDERELLELVAFMLVSSRNLMTEPPRYGPLRLIEATRRLIEVLERRGIATAFLREIEASVSEMPSRLMRSEQEFVSALDDLVEAVSARLATPAQGGSDRPQAAA
jgi:hypothetical protein